MTSSSYKYTFNDAQDGDWLEVACTDGAGNVVAIYDGTLFELDGGEISFSLKSANSSFRTQLKASERAYVLIVTGLLASNGVFGLSINISRGGDTAMAKYYKLDGSAGDTTVDRFFIYMA